MPILIPALIIASITMGYNYIRFHSVFDFGANYNLCSNDMRYRGWHWDRTFLAIYYYLFSPVITKPVFPFLEPNTLFTNYLGVTIFEEMFGGYYALMPFLFISTLAFLPKIQFKKTNIRCFSCISFMLAILILVVDAQMAGIVSRYRMDFGWLLCLSAIFVIVEIEYQASQSTIRYIMRIGIVTSLLSAMIYELLLIFNTTNIGTWWHPYFYYTAKSLLQFWN